MARPISFLTRRLKRSRLRKSELSRTQQSKADLRYFEVQGHRGARGLRPENTLAAFHLALSLGVDALELDTGLTADGVLVVCHNPEIPAKLCLHPDGTPVRRRPRLLIRKLTLEQVQAFDCGSRNPDPVQFPMQLLSPGEHIPTLAEVFEYQTRYFPKTQARYTIECKINPLRPRDTFGPIFFAQKIVNLVQEYGLLERVTVQSFDWRVLLAVKQLNAKIQTAALVRQRRGRPGTLLSRMGIASPFLAGLDFRRHQPDIAGLLRAAGFIDRYSPNFETLLPESRDFIQPVHEIQQAGFPVVPWTVNKATIMNRLIDLGADGIITDFPDVLLEILAQRGLR
ncbi:glycerophosphodiester phosphodiesterase family protein [Leptolyngbya sp. FACHB-261]|uniref:glycerophosphodiester phosphodiesterase family protein n=1 Tax=Leptolyngbya sp. FACHB-261 TaxID=2692806 RepID=UPI0016823E5C|nr:glycerophosphodiester phosphodiesterase family protein [Leptolyngbya sp. FACHB-261]MBD2099475.1 glycerophosphodiester phosphodiesterase [Leptolyngbya sp. FACHB-261]